MATEALKSLAITNRDATPQVHNTSFLEAGQLREAVGYVSAGAGDTSSKYIMCQIPSNARLSQVLLYSDDVGSQGAVDVGLYDTTANGGAAVHQDCIASAVDVNTAALNGTDITHESAASVNNGLANSQKQVWDMLGLTADPCKMYDVVITPTTALGTGGKFVLKVRYVV